MCLLIWTVFLRWVIWPMGLLFLYIFHFSIYFHFSEVKISQTIYWNHFFYTLHERRSGGYIGITVCPSVCLSVRLSGLICVRPILFCGIERSSKCNLHRVIVPLWNFYPTADVRLSMLPPKPKLLAMRRISAPTFV